MFKKSSVIRPILIEVGQNERVELRPGDILDDHLVDQGGKLAAEMPGVRGGGADKAGLLGVGVAPAHLHRSR
ncbi:MAG: hypothetical protein WDN29_01800 [Methylovirgula sp.]